jgi:hypothetical protein
VACIEFGEGVFSCIRRGQLTRHGGCRSWVYVRRGTREAVTDSHVTLWLGLIKSDLIKPWLPVAGAGSFDL